MPARTADGGPAALEGSVLGPLGHAIAAIEPADGRIEWANAACERLFGYGDGELAGRHISDISVAPVHSPGARAAAIERELAEAGVWSGDTEGVRADGTTFPCVTGFSELATGGSRLWIAIFMRAGGGANVAERPLAARRLSELVFEGATTAMAVIGTDLRVYDANRAFLELTARPYHETVGHGIAGVLHPDRVPADLDRLHGLLEGAADVVHAETRLVAADRRGLAVSLTAMLVRDIDRRPLSALLVLERAGGAGAP
jgi:PAS domain S-box-containing protein